MSALYLSLIHILSELSKGISGDPDVTGNEPVFGGPNNDVGDFDDFGNSYPGFGY